MSESISKEKAVNVLKEKSFETEQVNGVVMIFSNNIDDFDIAKTILENANYYNSFGWRQKIS